MNPVFHAQISTTSGGVGGSHFGEEWNLSINQLLLYEFRAIGASTNPWLLWHQLFPEKMTNSAYGKERGVLKTSNPILRINRASRSLVFLGRGDELS